MGQKEKGCITTLDRLEKKGNGNAKSYRMGAMFGRPIPILKGGSSYRKKKRGGGRGQGSGTWALPSTLPAIRHSGKEYRASP